MALYDSSNFSKLMDDLKSLTTFEGVADWDRQAEDELQRILVAVQQLDAEVARQSQAIAQARQEKSDKSFVGRLFAGDKEEKKASQLIEKYSGYKETLGKIAYQLREAIDFTPNSPDEQAALLKELQLRRKELQLEKREITSAMKETRTSARQKSAKAGTALGGAFYSPKIAAAQRRNIRYEKEAALRPHENAKASIERQLIQVEKDILWAEKFYQLIEVADKEVAGDE